ncbi:hypothetical protein Tco_0250321 [Tanacetum coccineum]
MTSKDQQIALDNALVAPENQRVIGKCNMRINPRMKPKEPTYQVVLDALVLTTCDPAFIITAEVPVIYMHQFWATINKNNASYRFKIDNKRFSVNVEVFRDILNICLRVPGQEFDEPPSEEEALSFIHELGHSGEIKYITDVIFDHLHQPLRTFASIINTCLCGKIDNKDFKKQYKMFYPRFTKIIIHYFIRKDKSMSMRNRTFMHIARDDSLLGDKPPKSKKPKRKSDSTILFEEIPSKKKPTKAKKDVASTKKPATNPKPTKKKAPVKADKGKRLDVLSKVALSKAAQLKEIYGTDEGTDAKPGVPDVPNYDSESEKESWGDSGEEEDDEDDTEDDDDNDGDDDDDNDGNDDDDDSDHERTKSNRDENGNVNQFNEENEEEEEENVDEFTDKEDDVKMLIRRMKKIHGSLCLAISFDFLRDFYYCSCYSSAAPVVETTLVASPTGLCGLVPYSGSDYDSPDEMSSPEHISLLPAISPFLCTDSFETPDSSDGPPSQDPYVATVARWSSRVTTRPSSSNEFHIAPVTGLPGIRQRSAILIRPREAIPFGRPYRTHLNGPYHHRSSSSLSLDSSLVHSSGLDASDQAHSGSSTRDVPPKLCYPPRRAPRHSEAFHRWCAALLSTLYPPTTSDLSSKRPLHSSSHSGRPSRKRCRSPIDSIPSSTPVVGSLAPTRADILPPRKRFRDSYSSEASIEEDT